MPIVCYKHIIESYRVLRPDSGLLKFLWHYTHKRTISKLFSVKSNSLKKRSTESSKGRWFWNKCFYRMALSQHPPDGCQSSSWLLTLLTTRMGLKQSIVRRMRSEILTCNSTKMDCHRHLSGNYVQQQHFVVNCFYVSGFVGFSFSLCRHCRWNHCPKLKVWLRFCPAKSDVYLWRYCLPLLELAALAWRECKLFQNSSSDRLPPVMIKIFMTIVRKSLT